MGSGQSHTETASGQPPRQIAVSVVVHPHLFDGAHELWPWRQRTSCPINVDGGSVHMAISLHIMADKIRKFQQVLFCAAGAPIRILALN